MSGVIFLRRQQAISNLTVSQQALMFLRRYKGRMATIMPYPGGSKLSVSIKPTSRHLNQLSSQVRSDLHLLASYTN